MESRICMNASCGTAMTHEWKRGWPLRSGGFADLCHNCGSAYENLVFCDQFHVDEPGWRECYLCRKRLHCGCIASKSLVELLDYGGVGCNNCVMSARLHKIQRDEIRNGYDGPTGNAVNDLSTATEIRAVGNGVDEGKLTELASAVEANEPNNLHTPPQMNDTNLYFVKDKRDDVIRQFANLSTTFSSPPQASEESTKFTTKQDGGRSTLDFVEVPESLSQPSLSMSLGVPSRNSNFVLPFSNGDGSKQSKSVPPFQQGQSSRPILPKPPKSGVSSESKCMSQLRIARQPIDGRGKNHLLPRYWPRISEQELQQLSGDLNSTVVPLFEKVLSASDAGRIGRLVLPKACAEAYFPPISQSEGLPIRIQDVKGKEWMFQFRFWPNNNSRMYVLEGVTPCIQSMQLRAGDTIIFSRIDPGGKLMMGFRKATNSEDTQDGQNSALPNGDGVSENLPSISGYSGHFQTPKGSKETYVNALSENLGLSEMEVGWHKSENHGGRMNGDSPTPEKKRARNIGAKSKRLLMHSEDAMELRLTWEEAQDLLRAPPNVEPSVVTIEDHEFEEYAEPPVFGKKTIFVARPSGGHEQWGQCDSCSKWRKLPMDVFLPSKWTCSDNVWDPSRRSCSAPMEMSHKELENLLRFGRDAKKRKIAENHKLGEESEPSGLDALASAAVLGENGGGDSGENSSGATTKHPRHRPGCTCIVCIQPPSGKGRHRPGCTCQVCSTVKRRFKTLMMRKKRRQSEREEAAAELARKEEDHQNSEADMNSAMKHHHDLVMQMNQRVQAEVGPETSSGHIDLNSHPNREDMQVDERGSNITGVVETGSLALESDNVNMQQQQQEEEANGNGLGVGLGVSSSSQSPSSCLQQQMGGISSGNANGESERHIAGEGWFSVGWLRDQEQHHSG